MFKIRQFDLSYESMENTRTKFHKVNCYISSTLMEHSQPAVDFFFRGEGNTLQLFY